MRSLFFIPVWNQIREFPRVLDELKAISIPCDEILIINNGSTDGSEDLVRTSGYPFLDLEKNLGVGYSFMKAIEWGMQRNFDILGGLASNGKMLPSEMSRLLTPILERSVDYVTGSRFLEGGAYPNLPKFRRASIPLVNMAVRALTGQVVSDSTCGFKAMKLNLFERARFDWRAAWLNGYSFEYYVFAKVLMNPKIRWCEVPVTMRYPAQGPYSKIPPFSGWYQMLRPWVIARYDKLGFD